MPNGQEFILVVFKEIVVRTFPLKKVVAAGVAPYRRRDTLFNGIFQRIAGHYPAAGNAYCQTQPWAGKAQLHYLSLRIARGSNLRFGVTAA